MRLRPIPKPEHVAFGAYLRGIREKRGLTQSQLGLKLGLPQSHISRLESGAITAGFLEILQICRVMDVKPSDLIDGYDAPSN